jgi:ribosomal-protein-alanine N-acetyltransferase
MAVRKGRIDDIPAFEYLDKLCFPQTIRYSRFDFLYYFFKKNVMTLVLEDERKVYGFLIADLKSPTEGHIVTIDVHPTYRRNGLGRQLMIEAERIFIDLGLQKVDLEVHESNVIAQIFYSKLGYRLEKKLFKFYHSGHGLRMVKLLQQDQPIKEELEVAESAEAGDAEEQKSTLASF